MARALRTLSESDLELALLRKSVGTLTAGRHVCADCGRTPLVGEHLFRFARHGVVCALCRPLRADEPEGIELVRHSERGHTVRRIVPRAA
jgi:hypothetical protein